jgi:hypothetical protein
MNFQHVIRELPGYAEKYLELAKRFPQLRVGPSEVLDWVGARRPRSLLAPSLLAFGSGVVVGAAAALVLAPRSGAELRAELLARLSEMMNKDDQAGATADDESSTEAPPVAAEHTGHA